MTISHFKVTTVPGNSSDLGHYILTNRTDFFFDFVINQVGDENATTRTPKAYPTAPRASPERGRRAMPTPGSRVQAGGRGVGPVRSP
eukprot:175855-Prymnesium_polylepis.1